MSDRDTDILRAIITECEDWLASRSISELRQTLENVRELAVQGLAPTQDRRPS